jgi:hypothetical protein
LTGIEKPHANKFKGINIFTLRNIKNPFLYWCSKLFKDAGPEFFM